MSHCAQPVTAFLRNLHFAFFLLPARFKGHSPDTALNPDFFPCQRIFHVLIAKPPGVPRSPTLENVTSDREVTLEILQPFIRTLLISVFSPTQSFQVSGPKQSLALPKPKAKTLPDFSKDKPNLYSQISSLKKGLRPTKPPTQDPGESLRSTLLFPSHPAPLLLPLRLIALPMGPSVVPV
jgi:hypothetical protein